MLTTRRLDLPMKFFYQRAWTKRWSRLDFSSMTKRKMNLGTPRTMFIRIVRYRQYKTVVYSHTGFRKQTSLFHGTGSLLIQVQIVDSDPDLGTWESAQENLYYIDTLNQKLFIPAQDAPGHLITIQSLGINSAAPGPDQVLYIRSGSPRQPVAADRPVEKAVNPLTKSSKPDSWAH